MRTTWVLACLSLAWMTGACGGNGEQETDAGIDSGSDAGFDGGADLVPTEVLVTGRVVDSQGTPVPNATVTIASDPVTTSTDADGAFEAAILTGDHTLTASKHGEVFLEIGFTAQGEGPIDLGTLQPEQEYLYNPIYMRGRNYLGSEFLAWQHWCSVTVEDEAGREVAGLGPEEFELTEELVRREDDATIVELPVDIAAQDTDDDPETGHWEHATGGEPIDIVFLTDFSGSMTTDVGSIREQVTGFVDRLAEHHVDFRLGAVSFVCRFEFNHTRRPYGPLETDRFLDEMAVVIRTTGGGSCATDAYEALLFTPWLGFRPEARKVAVLITDIVPQTVYGTTSETCATLSGVEDFLTRHGIELFYSQDPACGDPEYDCRDVAPRACDENSGLPALMQAGLAVPLAWPFGQQELWSLLFPPPGPAAPTNVHYLLAWKSGLDWWDPIDNLHHHPEDYLVRMTLRTPRPGAPGDFLQSSWDLPLERDEVDFTLYVQDAEGNPLDATWTEISYYRDGRPTRHVKWQQRPTDGVLEMLGVTPGWYSVDTRDDGHYDVTDASLTVIDRRLVVVPEEGLDLELPLHPSEATAFLSMARGLLRDLDDWRISGDPFGAFAADAELWLQDLEEGGLTWPEMIQLKRFTTTLSAYANLNEYAQLQTEGAVADFQNIVADFRSVLDELYKLEHDTEMGWAETITATALKIIYAVITQGRFTTMEEALNRGLNWLIDYAKDDVVTEIRNVILDQFPRNRMFTVLKTLFEECLVHTYNNQDANGPDWDAVMKAALDIGLGEALEEVRRLATDGFVDAAFGSFDLDEPLEREIKQLVQEVLRALTATVLDDEDGMKILGDAVEQFASGVATWLVDEGRERLLDILDDVFDRAEDAMRDAGVPAAVCDFQMGFARDLLRQAIPRMQEGWDGVQWVDFEIDTDQVVHLLIKHGLYNIVLRRFYADRAERALGHVLSNARAYTPAGTSRLDWAQAMEADFYELQQTWHALQAPAIHSLTDQERVDDWAEGLQYLKYLLGIISDPLDFIASIYPPLEPTATNVHRLIIVLNGIDIVTNAVQFGLKLNELDNLGKKTGELYQIALPD